MLEKETADLTHNSSSFKERFSMLEKETDDLTHNIDSFKERFSMLEKETAHLTNKIQSMTVGTETLFKRIRTVEYINQTLSKGYDRLTECLSKKVIYMP